MVSRALGILYFSLNNKHSGPVGHSASTSRVFQEARGRDKLCKAFEVHPHCSMYQYFIQFHCWVFFYCMYVQQFDYPLIDWPLAYLFVHHLMGIRIISSLWLVWINLLKPFVCKFCMNKIAKLFPRVSQAIPFKIPTNNIRQFLHIFPSIWYYHFFPPAIFVCVWWYLIVVCIWISLMTSDAGELFM